MSFVRSQQDKQASASAFIASFSGPMHSSDSDLHDLGGITGEVEFGSEDVL